MLLPFGVSLRSVRPIPEFATRYYVRTWKRRDEPRGWQVGDSLFGGASASEEYTSEKPARRLCDRKNRDWWKLIASRQFVTRH